MPRRRKPYRLVPTPGLPFVYPRGPKQVYPLGKRWRLIALELWRYSVGVTASNLQRMGIPVKSTKRVPKYYGALFLAWVDKKDDVELEARGKAKLREMVAEWLGFKEGVWWFHLMFDGGDGWQEWTGMDDEKRGTWESYIEDGDMNIIMSWSGEVKDL